MFHHRHKFHVCISHFFTILCRFVSQFTIGIKTAAHRFFKRSKVHLINDYRLFFPIGLFSLFQPVCILPLVFVNTPDNACTRRTFLGIKTIRIGLHHGFSIISVNFVFVNIAIADFRYKQLKDTAFEAAHRMKSAIPVVKITDNTDADRIRCPDGKPRTGISCHMPRMCSEFLVDFVMLSTGKHDFVHRIHKMVRCVAVNNFHFPRFILYLIRVFRYLLTNHQCCEITTVIHFFHNNGTAFPVDLDQYFICFRKETAEQDPIFDYRRSQNVFNIPAFGIFQILDLRPVHIIFQFLFHKYLLSNVFPYSSYHSTISSPFSV